MLGANPESPSGPKERCNRGRFQAPSQVWVETLDTETWPAGGRDLYLHSGPSVH